ncbi:MAG: hypothetical protein FJ147_07205 [Deltaproteobacteria bacterium]|nr:hypothetical protein [Deltaproteobacteria bacterium]
MKQQQVVRFFRVGLCAAVVGMSTLATADITRNWESPANNQEISGIQQFRGFAFSTTSSQPLSVKLLVTSPLNTTIEVPWGAARGDVGANPPQLNSGFGVTVNAGLLPAGSTASITLEVRESGSSGACTAPTCVSETRTFTVAKPGARSGEANTAFSFLNDLDVAGATNLLVDGDEIIVAPVDVVDSGNGGTRKSTIRLRWIQNAQAFGTVDAASGTSFAGVQSILTKYNCAASGCHGSSGAQAGLNLESGQAFRNMIAKSSEDATRLRINPGNSTASYLFQKVRAGGNITGGRMPLGCSGNNCLTDAEVATIQSWIDEGAPPPQ